MTNFGNKISKIRNQVSENRFEVNKKSQIMMCQGAILGDIWFKYVIIGGSFGL